MNKRVQGTSGEKAKTSGERGGEKGTSKPMSAKSSNWSPASTSIPLPEQSREGSCHSQQMLSTRCTT
eukprot:4497130-Amphidinium_carterae.1